MSQQKKFPSDFICPCCVRRFLVESTAMNSLKLNSSRLATLPGKTSRRNVSYHITLDRSDGEWARRKSIASPEYELLFSFPQPEEALGKRTSVISHSISRLFSASLTSGICPKMTLMNGIHHTYVHTQHTYSVHFSSPYCTVENHVHVTVCRAGFFTKKLAPSFPTAALMLVCPRSCCSRSTSEAVSPRSRLIWKPSGGGPGGYNEATKQRPPTPQQLFTEVEVSGISTAITATPPVTPATVYRDDRIPVTADIITIEEDITVTGAAASVDRCHP